MKRFSLNKSTITIIAIVIILIYFIAMFFIFKPNVLTWWSNEYEYVSEARNFALFSKLETSFYSAESALNGDLPSYGYHPILYSFLAGLFLKIFGSAPWATFIFNYILTFLALLIVYLYGKDRINRKNISYPLILIAVFPVMVIYANTQSPEAFFFMLIPLIYYLYFKNKDNFNVVHFIILLLIAIATCQRFIYITLLIPVVFTYYKWIKDRKPLRILPSLLFFISSYYLLYMAFGLKTQLYPVIQEGLKFFGYPGFFSFFIFFLIIIISNIVLAFTIKNQILRRELFLILAPQLTLICISVIYYPFTDFEPFLHLVPLLGFIPFNLFFLYVLIKEQKFKLRFFSSLLLFLLLCSTSFFLYKPLYISKTEKSIDQIGQNVEKIEELLAEYRYKDILTIFSKNKNTDPFQDYIVYGNNRDKFILADQFSLNDNMFKELTEKPFIDIWFERESEIFALEANDYYIEKQYRTFPFIFNVSIYNDNWVILLKEEAFEKEYNYRITHPESINSWKLINQGNLHFEDSEILVDSMEGDSYIENIIPLRLKEDTQYYIKIIIIPSEDTHAQILSITESGSFDENKSFEYPIYRDIENIIITKISGNIIRINPGLKKGTYSIKALDIFSLINSPKK